MGQFTQSANCGAPRCPDESPHASRQALVPPRKCCLNLVPNPELSRTQTRSPAGDWLRSWGKPELASSAQTPAASPSQSRVPPKPKPLRQSHLRPSQVKHPGLSPIYTQVPAHSSSNAQGGFGAGGNLKARGTPRAPPCPGPGRSRALMPASYTSRGGKHFAITRMARLVGSKKTKLKKTLNPVTHQSPDTIFILITLFFCYPPLFRDVPRPIHQYPHTTHFPREPAPPSPSAASPRGGAEPPSVGQDLAPRDGARSLQRPHPATSARRPAQPSLPTKPDPGDTAEGLRK